MIYQISGSNTHKFESISRAKKIDEYSHTQSIIMAGLIYLDCLEKLLHHLLSNHCIIIYPVLKAI